MVDPQDPKCKTVVFQTPGCGISDLREAKGTGQIRCLDCLKVLSGHLAIQFDKHGRDCHSAALYFFQTKCWPTHAWRTPYIIFKAWPVGTF